MGELRVGPRMDVSRTNGSVAVSFRASATTLLCAKKERVRALKPYDVINVEYSEAYRQSRAQLKQRGREARGNRLSKQCRGILQQAQLDAHKC